MARGLIDNGGVRGGWRAPRPMPAIPHHEPIRNDKIQSNIDTYSTWKTQDHLHDTLRWTMCSSPRHSGTDSSWKALGCRVCCTGLEIPVTDTMAIFRFEKLSVFGRCKGTSMLMKTRIKTCNISNCCGDDMLQNQKAPVFKLIRHPPRTASLRSLNPRSELPRPRGRPP